MPKFHPYLRLDDVDDKASTLLLVGALVVLMIVLLGILGLLITSL